MSPLAALVGPLRFASRNDWAHLTQVKGLRGLLQKVVEQAEALGWASAQLPGLRAELERVDSASLALRKAAISRLLLLVEEAQATGGRRSRVSLPHRPPQPVAAAPRASAASTSAPSTSASRKTSRGPHLLGLESLGLRIAPRLAQALAKREVSTVADLLFRLPRGYEDRRVLQTLALWERGTKGVGEVTVKQVKDTWGRGRRGFRVSVADATGSATLSFFRSPSWLKTRFPVGETLWVAGELKEGPSGPDIAHPEAVRPREADAPIHFRRWVPLYPGLEPSEQRSYRALTYRVVERCAASIPDPLPADLRERLSLVDLGVALRAAHFPPAEAEPNQLATLTTAAHRRLAFDELLFLQLGLALRRAGAGTRRGIAFDTSAPTMVRAKSVVPFSLTRAQKRSIEEVARDMSRPEPMLRLLQGDVGSGKTAVAMIAAAIAVAGDYQVAMMAPTEILAAQHFETLRAAFEPRGIQVALLRGSAPAKEKRAARALVVEGGARIAVGTHALLEGDVAFPKLGLVVIDEQHRFGVRQRQSLMGKGLEPDVLVMTATPIPRTLAMALYGDMSVSVLDELPPGRRPVRTEVFIGNRRTAAEARLEAALAQGRRAYVVYPLVEESEDSDLADATQGAEVLAARFPKSRIGLLHGRMKAAEKQAVMDGFRRGDVRVLVCTTVVEVGVDVPEASLIVVEAAERFGLSQLHQLRGRVGRGHEESECFLLANSGFSKVAAERLRTLESTQDGFVIAEKDLELRGPGELLGTRQSGLPELTIANLARDQALLSAAQGVARELLEADPKLSAPAHRALAAVLAERWQGRLALARVG
ncbi:MAG: ATP-dependent DNA helicase RecG [Myxococcaceae bacterium]